MKRRIIVSVGAVVVIGSVVACGVVNWRSKRCSVDIRVENYSLLRDGMSEKEIEEILCGSAGDYTSRPNVKYSSVYNVTGLGPRKLDQLSAKTWRTDEIKIEAYFDSQGKARWIVGYPAVPPPPSMRYPQPLRQIMQLLDP